ncbi:MAG: ABC transporter substrate-binding protein [Limnochordia bacterium]
MRTRVFLGLLLVLLISGTAFARVEVEFWHAMGGHNMEIVNGLVEKFNASQDKVWVTAQMTGTYDDTLQKLQAAVQTGTAPHIVQVYEIGSQVMIDSGIIMPVEVLGKEIAKDLDFDWDKFIPPVKSYYTINGVMHSMPFNSSTPLFYYNRDAFVEVGLDPNKPPTTFEEIMDYSRKLTIKDDRGNIERYGLTMATYGWFVEQIIANQGALYANNDNGRTARATEILWNGEAGVRLATWWKQMVDEGLLLNPGRSTDAAKQAFLSGRAAMILESSAQITNFTLHAQERGYDLGTAFIPCPGDVDRNGVIIGGASLWVIADHPEEELKGAWEFLKWLTEAEQQAHWFKNTGYLPATKASVELVMNERFFAESPNHVTPFLQLLMTKVDYPTRGALIGGFPEIRSIAEETIEEILLGRATVQEALDKGVARANRVLAEYNAMFAD